MARSHRSLPWLRRQSRQLSLSLRALLWRLSHLAALPGLSRRWVLSHPARSSYARKPTRMCWRRRVRRYRGPRRAAPGACVARCVHVLGVRACGAQEGAVWALRQRVVGRCQERRSTRVLRGACSACSVHSVRVLYRLDDSRYADCCLWCSRCCRIPGDGGSSGAAWMTATGRDPTRTSLRDETGAAPTSALVARIVARPPRLLAGIGRGSGRQPTEGLTLAVGCRADGCRYDIRKVSGACRQSSRIVL